MNNGEPPTDGWGDLIALVLFIFIAIMVLIPALEKLFTWLNI